MILFPTMKSAEGKGREKETKQIKIISGDQEICHRKTRRILFA